VQDDVRKVLKRGERPHLIRVVAGGRVSTPLREKWEAIGTRRGVPIEIWAAAEFEERLRHDCESLLFRFHEGIPFPDTPDQLLALARDADSAADAIRTMHARGTLSEAPILLNHVTTAAPGSQSIPVVALDREQASTHPSRAPTNVPNTVPRPVVSIAQQDALAIVATSPFSVDETQLTECFPNIAWAKQLRGLERARHLVREENEKLRVPQRVVRALFVENEAARKPFEERWIDALKAHDGDPTAALAIALLYSRHHRLEEAVALLVQHAATIDSAEIAGVYLSSLEPILESGAKRLSARARLELLNAVGMLLVDVGRYDEALARFRQLERSGTGSDKGWASTQSFINRGVALTKAGRTADAEAAYESAIRWARRTRDKFVLGRALTNLATTVLPRDYVRASRLLTDGIEAKMSAGDQAGLVSSFLTRGNLAASQDNFGEAEHWYNICVIAAHETNERYVLSLALSNLGKTYLETNRPCKAVTSFKAARRLAADEGMRDALEIATRGLAVAFLKGRRWRDAEATFSELLESSPPDPVAALNDLGVVQAAQGKLVDAQRTYRRGLKAADDAGDESGRASIEINLAASLRDQGQLERAFALLSQSAVAADRRRSYRTGAELWRAAADLLQLTAATDARIPVALSHAERDLSKVGDRSESALVVRMNRYCWLRDEGDTRAALKAVIDIVGFAADIGAANALARGLDELGCTLQRLGEFEQAEAAHRRSLRLAKRIHESEMMETASNNLGLLLLQLGRSKRALSVFRSAREAAACRGSIETASVLAGNEALALISTGSASRALALLRQWQRRAGKARLWFERFFLQQTEAKALRQQGRIHDAARTYSMAFSEVRRQSLDGLEPAVREFAALVVEMANSRPTPKPEIQRLERQVRRLQVRAARDDSE